VRDAVRQAFLNTSYIYARVAYKFTCPLGGDCRYFSWNSYLQIV